jgi:hypothetical protein
MQTFAYFLVLAKFVCGLAMISIGIGTNEAGAIIAGAGHSFILAPLWAYLIK